MRVGQKNKLTYRWARKGSRPLLPMINGPNRPTCSVRFAPNAEPAPPSCCRPATPKLCSFTSMRSQPKSLRALTLLSSSIKPGGMAPRPSRFQTTSRSCSFRHAHLNSTAKKISGNSCGRTGCRTEFSNPSTISSTTAATLGTRSSTSPGRSCPSPDATGQQSVTQTEDWYKAYLSEHQSLRSKDRLSKATLYATLSALKRFFLSLAGQPGYKSRISYSDAEYFNLSAKDTRIAKAHREARVPTLEQIRHAIRTMPATTEIERRDRALIAFTILTGARDGAIASFKFKHIDIDQRWVDQDARQGNTKV